MLNLLKSFWDRAISEGGVVQSAPTLFATAVLFLTTPVSLGIWAAMDWRYSGVIANRDATIGARDSQIGLMAAQIKDLEGRIAQLKTVIPAPQKNPDAINQLGSEVGVGVGAQSDLGNGKYYFRAINANGDFNRSASFVYRGLKLKVASYSTEAYGSVAGRENRKLTDVVCEVLGEN